MVSKRVSYSAEFKAKIAILALSETVTFAEISSKYKINGSLISKWKKELQDRGKEIFETKSKKDNIVVELQSKQENLYKQIWELTVENDWMKKKCVLFNIPH